VVHSSSTKKNGLPKLEKKSNEKDLGPSYADSNNVYIYKDLDEVEYGKKLLNLNSNGVQKPITDGNGKSDKNGKGAGALEALPRIDFRNDYFWNEGDRRFEFFSFCA
jgi:hypothetical protein